MNNNKVTVTFVGLTILYILFFLPKLLTAASTTFNIISILILLILVAAAIYNYSINKKEDNDE